MSAYGNTVSFGDSGGTTGNLKIVRELKNGLTSLIEPAKKFREQLKGITTELKEQVKLQGALKGGGSGLMTGALGKFSAPGGGGGSGSGIVGGKGPIDGRGPFTAGGLGGNGAGATAGRIALGLAAFTYAAIPSTQDAVGQRIAAQSVASFSGMSARNLTSYANSFGYASGGMTSSTGMTMAAANLMYKGGYTANSQTFRNIMPQVGALSAATGMSNEQVAGAYAGMNGMTALRMGFSIRDRKGNLNAPNAIADSLYRRMYGRRKISDSDAAKVWNPNSADYQNVMALAGGNQDLFISIATNLQMQAKNGGKKVSLANADRVMDQLGYAENDPRRSTFNKNSSESKLLENSSEGLINGYNAAANAASALTTALSMLPGPILDLIGTIKGFTESIGGMGNAGGAASGAIGSAAGMMGSALLMSGGGRALAGKGISALRGGGGAGIARVGANGLANFGKATPLLGAAGMTVAGAAVTAVAGNYLTDRARDAGRSMGVTQGSAVDRIGTVAAMAGTGAATGALIGSVIPGIGTAAGAVIGTLVGGYQGWQKSNDPAQADGLGGSGTNYSAKSTPAAKKGVSAVTWATQVAGSQGERWYHLCDRFVANAYGRPRSGYASALVHWGSIPQKLRRPGATDAPAGALVFWKNGKWGHVALSVGNGNVQTTHRNGGVPTTVSIAQCTKELGGPGIYLGWAEPYFGGKTYPMSGGPAKATEGSENTSAGTIATASGGLSAPAGGAAASSGITVDSSGISGSSLTTAQLLGAGVGSAPSGPNGAAPGLSARSGKLLIPDAAGGASKVDAKSETYAGGSGPKWLAKFLQEKGVQGEALKSLWALGMRESSGRPSVDNAGVNKNGSVDYGLWQINSIHEPWLKKTFGWTMEDMRDPDKNFRAMWRMTQKGKNFSSWNLGDGGYDPKNRGKHTAGYEKWRGQFEQMAPKLGVRPQADTGEERVQFDQLMKVHKDEMILTADQAERVRGGKGGGANVTINVNVQRASEDEAVRLARRVKSILEQDNVMSAMGRY